MLDSVRSYFESWTGSLSFLGKTLFSLTVSLLGLEPRGEGRGVLDTKFYTGKLRPEVQTVTFFVCHF